MLNYIWAGLILISFIVAAFTGRIEATTQAVFDGASSAIDMCISLLGIMCLWTGVIKIGEKSGLVNKISIVLRPVTALIFPKLKKNSAAHNAIVMNMVANILGMSNAATPLGIEAIKELDKLNNHSTTASDEMCMFVVINTASLQLIPATVIAMRQMHGSQYPSNIFIPVWIASICSIAVGVICAKIFQRTKKETY